MCIRDSYTAPQEDSNVKTVLDGIITKLSPSRVEYVRGCAIRDTTVNEICLLYTSGVQIGMPSKGYQSSQLFYGRLSEMRLWTCLLYTSRCV